MVYQQGRAQWEKKDKDMMIYIDACRAANMFHMIKLCLKSTFPNHVNENVKG